MKSQQNRIELVARPDVMKLSADLLETLIKCSGVAKAHVFDEAEAQKIVDLGEDVSALVSKLYALETAKRDAKVHQAFFTAYDHGFFLHNYCPLSFP